MKITLLTAIAALACGSLAQLYPTKLTILETAAFRLGDGNVRSELRATEQQKAQILEIISEHSNKQLQISQELVKAKPDRYPVLQAQLEAAELVSRRKLLNVLNPSQAARLREIAIQDEGAYILRDPSVAKQVGITAAQGVKIKAIIDRTTAALDDLSGKMGEQLEAAAKSGSDARQAGIVKSFQPKLDAIEAKGKADILNLLSPPQRAVWKKINGAPFKN